MLGSALLEEFPSDLVPLLLALALHLLAPNRALREDLLEPRLADAHETTFSSPVGDWKDAGGLEDVLSGVVPER